MPADNQITVSVFWFIHKCMPQEGKVPQGFAVSVVFVQLKKIKIFVIFNCQSHILLVFPLYKLTVILIHVTIHCWNSILTEFSC